MENNAYNTQSAILHTESGFYTVTIHDRMPGRNGYTGVIQPDGTHEFVEDGLLAYGEHDPFTCEACMDSEWM